MLKRINFLDVLVFSFIFLLAISASLSTAEEPKMSDEAKKSYDNVKTDYDPFKKQTAIYGLSLTKNTGDIFVLWRLASIVEKDGSKSFAISLGTMSEGWGFYKEALDKDSKEFVIVRRDSSIGDNGKCIEDYIIMLDEEYVKKNSSGITIKVYGQKGKKFVIEFSKDYLEGFMKKVSEVPTSPKEDPAPPKEASEGY